jgi:hypothetical protein
MSSPVGRLKNPHPRQLSAIGFIIIFFTGLLLITGFLESNFYIKVKPENMTQEELYSFSKIRDVHLLFKDST